MSDRDNQYCGIFCAFTHLNLNVIFRVFFSCPKRNLSLLHLKKAPTFGISIVFRTLDKSLEYPKNHPYLKLKAHHYDANRHGIIRLSSAAAVVAAMAAAKWVAAAAVTSGTKCIFNINTS